MAIPRGAEANPVMNTTLEDDQQVQIGPPLEMGPRRELKEMGILKKRMEKKGVDAHQEVHKMIRMGNLGLLLDDRREDHKIRQDNHGLLLLALV